MGTITGAFGGIIRDILINEEPLIFRKDIYALACIVGGIFYWGCYTLQLPDEITQSIAAASVYTHTFLLQLNITGDFLFYMEMMMNLISRISWNDTNPTFLKIRHLSS